MRYVAWGRLCSHIFSMVNVRRNAANILSSQVLWRLGRPLTNENAVHSNYNHTLHCCMQWRMMTTSKRVQDRSKKKRVHDLEVALEKHKILSKILFVFEMLKDQPEQVMPVRDLDRHRRQINLPKPHKISVFLRKSPKLFELYKDDKGLLWCGMTKLTEKLVDEEEKIIQKNSDKAAEYVSRMLMMSVDKRLPLEKIAHFRRDLGLPFDFRSKWVHRYPENFRVAKPFVPYDEREYLELVDWNPSWAITELEKKLGKTLEINGQSAVPGLLSLGFPMKFPPNYKKVLSRYTEQINSFQKMEYLSPYADARDLKAGSKEFDKRAVAVMHELLSFMMEKRLVTDHLTHFRREFVMPQKLMRLLLKHFGIFYVSEKGRRFSVFLKEAYEGSELIEKHPLVAWREKVNSHIDYRRKKQGTVGAGIEYLSDMEDEDLFADESESDGIYFDDEQHETLRGLDDVSPAGGSEMEVEALYTAYTD